MDYLVFALTHNFELVEVDRTFDLATAMVTLKEAAGIQATALVMFQGRTIAYCNGGQLVEVTAVRS